MKSAIAFCFAYTFVFTILILKDMTDKEERGQFYKQIKGELPKQAYTPKQLEEINQEVFLRSSIFYGDRVEPYGWYFSELNKENSFSRFTARCIITRRNPWVQRVQTRYSVN